MAPGNGSGEERKPASRLLVAGLVVVGAVVAGYFVLGMPGMDHSGAGRAATGTPSSADHSGMGGMRVGVDEFAATMDDPDAVVINVHTPYEGEIEGTDLAIAYDQIVSDARLPNAKDARVLLYCRTGRMSQEAAADLMAAGYTNVVDLEGGMQAWEESGRSLVSRDQADS